MASVKGAAEAGEQRTSVHRPGVVETVFVGRLTVKLLDAAHADIVKVGVAPVWLIDTTDTSGFDTDCVRFGSTMLQRLRKAGVQRLVAVLPSAAMRMAARAAAVASGVEIRVVERRSEAVPHLALAK
ncbi:MAG: hypothetical protein R3F14_03945 [Polyangiaceae bacterium]